MKKAGHRLALVAAPSALSLQLLSSLSERYSVSSWGNPERAVVQFRQERPALVVVVCSRRNQGNFGCKSIFDFLKCLSDSIGPFNRSS